MQGKLKDASYYFRIRSAWPLAIYAVRRRKKSQKSIAEDGAKVRRY